MIGNLLKEIYKKKQLVKYVIGGGTAAMVDISLLYAFTDIFELWIVYSASLAFLLAFFVSFYIQKHWTFDDDRKTGATRQLILYFGVGVINLAINAGGMYILVEKFNVMYILAQIGIGAAIAISSFLVYKFIIFKRHRNEKKRKNKGPRVLIATGIFPPDIGGPATMLKDMVGSLTAKGINIKVITYADKSAHEFLDFEGKKVEIYKVKKYSNLLFRHICYFRRMRKLARRSDVIYVTDTYSVGYFAYIIKRVMDKKYIVRFAGDSAWETSVSNGWTKDYIIDFQKKKYDEKIEKLKKKRTKILKSANKVIAVSGFMSDLAKIIGVKDERIKIIYNSVDFMDEVEVNQNEVEEIKIKYGNNKKILVTSCRLTPWKGIDGVIKALPEIMKRVGGVNFIILGDGPELENLKKLTEEIGVRDNVIFLGRIKHDETMKYFKAADLYILNTNYEGFSHALMDVMKNGAPIVTTNVGGNPELIKNNEEGILINYNNQEELVGASVKILNDKELSERFVSNAKNKIKKFNWNNTVNETIKILNKYV